MKIVNKFVFSCECGQQKPEDPQIEPAADDAITESVKGGLGSLACICEDKSSFHTLSSFVTLYYQAFLYMKVLPHIDEKNIFVGMRKGTCEMGNKEIRKYIKLLNETSLPSNCTIPGLPIF